jgi:hypothetical protein
MKPCIAKYVLPFGTLVCAVGTLIADVLNFVDGLQKLVVLDVEAIVVRVYVLLFSILLVLVSLMQSTSLFKFFGFLQYVGGTASLLIFVGGLTLGMGPIGIAAGVGSLIWGFFCISIACCERRRGAALRTESLLYTYPAV